MAEPLPDPPHKYAATVEDEHEDIAPILEEEHREAEDSAAEQQSQESLKMNTRSAILESEDPDSDGEVPVTLKSMPTRPKRKSPSPSETSKKSSLPAKPVKSLKKKTMLKTRNRLAHSIQPVSDSDSSSSDSTPGENCSSDSDSDSETLLPPPKKNAKPRSARRAVPVHEDSSESDNESDSESAGTSAAKQHRVAMEALRMMIVKDIISQKALRKLVATDAVKDRALRKLVVSDAVKDRALRRLIRENDALQKENEIFQKATQQLSDDKLLLQVALGAKCAKHAPEDKRRKRFSLTSKSQAGDDSSSSSSSSSNDSSSEDSSSKSNESDSDSDAQEAAMDRMKEKKRAERKKADGEKASKKTKRSEKSKSTSKDADAMIKAKAT
ncbi:hypothetical protein LTS10_008448 [Elasticomyces elasticus]|nr:hypothetical protein LTS10_008448 [Elasticomyces elasticus]